MHLFELLAERKIEEAVSRGELDHLPGAGRPLELDDDSLVPEDLRLAYRVLKNAGLVPPEVEELKEQSLGLGKLALLKPRIEGAYYGKALKRLSRRG